MNSVLYWTFLVYFATHIPITICLDLQALLGSIYPLFLRNLNSWYCSNFNDELMAMTPIWFKTFILLELIFQLPFFFVAVYAFVYRRNWIRIPGIVYGTHVATTVAPILSSTMLSKNSTLDQKIVLFSFYFPYLLIPVLLALYMIRFDNPFHRIDDVKKKV